MSAKTASGSNFVLMVDVDGVLVKGRPADGLHWSTFLREDIGVDPSALNEKFFAPHFEEIVTGRAGLKDRLVPVLAEIAPNVGFDELVAYWFSHDSGLDRHLINDLAAVRSAGVSVHIATNQEHLRARYLFDELGLGRVADAFHYSAELGCRKPDSRFFELVTKRVTVEMSQILLIDDMPANVDAARAAGWQARLWTREMRLSEVLASAENGRAGPVDSLGQAL